MTKNDTIACWVCGHNAEPGSGHLELLKRLRIHISQAVFAETTAPRDLASLSRRLQDLTKEIDILEERAQLEGKSSGSTTNDKSISEGYDSSEV